MASLVPWYSEQQDDCCFSLLARSSCSEPNLVISHPLLIQKCYKNLLPCTNVKFQVVIKISLVFLIILTKPHIICAKIQVYLLCPYLCVIISLKCDCKSILKPWLLLKQVKRKKQTQEYFL